MAQEFEFQRPSQEVMRNILHSHLVYEQYIDGLMLIHDVLCEYTAEPEVARFSKAEIDQQIDNLTNQDTYINHLRHPDMYLSYSRRDTEAMQRLQAELGRGRIVVWSWTSADISWDDALTTLENARSFGVIVSPFTRTASGINRELSLALELKKPIFPIIMSGDISETVPESISELSHVDLRGEVFEEGIESLTDEVYRRLEINPRRILSLPPGAAGNIETNYSYARKIRNEAQEVFHAFPRGDYHRDAVELQATRFIRELLRLYGTLATFRYEIGLLIEG
jgi:hypothetical protein